MGQKKTQDEKKEHMRAACRANEHRNSLCLTRTCAQRAQYQ